MTEEMRKALEAAIFRVVYESLRRIDAAYPRRDYVTQDYIQHMICSREVMDWYEINLLAIRSEPSIEEPRLIRRRRSRPLPQFDGEWSLIANMFGGFLPDVQFGLECLPEDVAVLLTAMNRAIALAAAMQIVDCMAHLTELAANLNDDEAKRRGAGRNVQNEIVVKPSPTPAPGRTEADMKRIERTSNEIADRFKRLFGTSAEQADIKKSARP